MNIDPRLVGKNPCRICGCDDSEKPMCFRGEPYCSDNCRRALYVQTLDEQYQISGEEMARIAGLPGKPPPGRPAAGKRSTGRGGSQGA